MYLNKYIHSKKIDQNICLLNLITFKIVILNSTDSFYFENLQYDKISIIDEMKKEGYFQEDYEREDFLKKRMILVQEVPNKYTTCVISITNKCNQRCPYCFESSLLNHDLNTMSIEQIDNVFKYISNLPEHINLSIMGGEPLLVENREILSYIIHMARKKDITDISLVTNGIMLNEFSDFLLENQDIISALIVTLNGYKETHELIRNSQENPTYDRILNNINFILGKTEKINININYLLEERNTKEVEKVLSDLKKRNIYQDKRVVLRIGQIQFRTNPDTNYKYKLDNNIELPMILYKYEKEFFKDRKLVFGSENQILFDLYNFWVFKQNIIPNLKTCEASLNQKHVFYPDNNVYACTDAMGNKNFVIGNYKRGLKIKNDIHDYRMKNIECFECKYALMCNGSCPLSAYYLDPKMNKVYCLKIKESIDELIELLFLGGKLDEYRRI